MTDTRTFTQWLADVALAAGYDTAPGRGGRSELAKAIGVDASVIGKIFSGNAAPSVQTQRLLAKTLRVELRELLIRSGTVQADDLPAPGEHTPPPIEEIDLYAVAAKFGIPPERAHLFVKSVEAVANTFADEKKQLG